MTGQITMLLLLMGTDAAIHIDMTIAMTTDIHRSTLSRGSVTLALHRTCNVAMLRTASRMLLLLLSCG